MARGDGPCIAPFRAIAGQVLKTSFTIRPNARYAGVMLMLAAAAAIAVSTTAAAPAPAAGATVRATASVRILTGTTINWSSNSSELPRIRQAQIRDASGAAQTIRLVEFE